MANGKEPRFEERLPAHARTLHYSRAKPCQTHSISPPMHMQYPEAGQAARKNPRAGLLRVQSQTLPQLARCGINFLLPGAQNDIKYLTKEFRSAGVASDTVFQ